MKKKKGHANEYKHRSGRKQMKRAVAQRKGEKNEGKG